MKLELTERRDGIDLLAVLRLEATSDPLSVRGRHGHTTDLSEHVAGSHDQNDGDSEDSPGPAAAEDRGEIADGQSECEERAAEDDPGSPVDRGTVGNWDGGVCGELVGELFCAEATGNGGI